MLRHLGRRRKDGLIVHQAAPKCFGAEAHMDGVCGGQDSAKDPSGYVGRLDASVKEFRANIERTDGDLEAEIARIYGKYEHC